MAHPSDSATDAQTSAQLLRPAFWASLLLALQLTYLFYGIDIDLRSIAPGDRGLPLARLEDSKLEVRAKTAGTLIWSPPEPGQALYRQDAIATMAGAEAKVKFPDGTEITVEESSLVIFEEPPKSDFFGFGRTRAIAARLFKGSIKKTHAGTAPVLLKFSDKKDAQSLRLDDTSGISVFRVVFAKDGIRVIVENGALRAQISDRALPMVRHDAPLTLTPESAPANNDSPSLLPPPILRKPRIEIQERGRPDTAPSAALHWIFRSAWAASSSPSATPGRSKEISITFSWDVIKGASRYQVQLSMDENFHDLLLEKSAAQAKFEYVTAPPEKDTTLYFRVAGVDSLGRVGEYSSTGRVEIQRQSQPAAPTDEKIAIVPARPLPFAVPRSKSSSMPVSYATTQAMIDSAIEGSQHRAPPPLSPVPRVSGPPAPEPEISVRIASLPPAYLAEVALGAAYHSRTLRNPADRLPRETVGSGFVPARIRAAFTRVPESAASWEISTGFAYLFEQASADVPLTGVNRVGTATIQAWMILSKTWGSLQLGAGPYLGSSHRIGFLESRLDSQLLWLGGAAFSAGPATRKPILWRWELRVAALALGSPGVDLSLSARRYLRQSVPCARAEGRGLYAGLEVQARATSVEGSSAAIVEVGYGI